MSGVDDGPGAHDGEVGAEGQRQAVRLQALRESHGVLDEDVAEPSGDSAKPQRDHSEREWGGDQDIDTAGMVPGNKATDDDEPTGF